jgi:RNA polymerase sigma factor (sigma-70 family)
VDVTRPPFQQLVDEHGAAVMRVCRAVVGRHDAEDAWSETFLAALAAYDRLHPDSNIRGWLVTIAHRKAIDQLRARDRRAIPTDAMPERTDQHDDQRDPELWTAFDELSERQRRSIAYHHLAGLPYGEVAELLGGTPAAVRRAAADGIAHLRTRFPKGLTQ